MTSSSSIGSSCTTTGSSNSSSSSSRSSSNMCNNSECETSLASLGQVRVWIGWSDVDRSQLSAKHLANASKMVRCTTVHLTAQSNRSMQQPYFPNDPVLPPSKRQAEFPPPWPRVLVQPHSVPQTGDAFPYENLFIVAGPMWSSCKPL
jgi:hypothetical protein